jgi:acyl carrier protein
MTEGRTAVLTDADVLDVVRNAVARVLEIDPGAVTAASTFVGDLHADSLALVEIVEIVEEQLAPHARGGFRIDDEDLEELRTVGEAVSYARARL